MCDGFDDLQSDSETNEQWGRYDDIERAHLLCNDTADNGASRTKLRLECCGKVPAPPTQLSGDNYSQPCGIRPDTRFVQARS